MSLVTASRNVVTRIGHGDAQAPRQFGKYRVLFELGRGGMATVYLAVTRSAGGVNKLVVLKALLPQFAAEPEARAMFLDEARLAAQLNHGNVVQTYEAGQADDCQVIVMEYLEGQSLASLLKRGHTRGQPLPLGLHLRVLMQVLDGLHYTHELRGYDGAPLRPVHRDISPQNVFITYDGRTKVLDFGIAKATTSTTHTAAGLIKGKIAYMAPEQMAGAAVDRRADIFAVGCMLWAAAAGRKLWADATDVNILHDVVHNAIPTPRSRNPDCDPELERIVMKALATVDARYSSALELHDDLEKFCEARAIPERPRELARVMVDWFAEDRAELTARVERELALPESELGIAAAASESSEIHLALPSAVEQQATTSTRTVSVATVNAIPTKSRPGSKWRAPAVAVAVVAAAFIGYVVLSHKPQEPALASKAEAAPVVAPVAVAPQPSVKIELRALPSTARLSLDDEPLSGNPVLRVFPKGGTVHRLRAEQGGYVSASAEFTTDGDRAVELELAPSQAPRKVEQQSSAARRSNRSPAAKVATTSAPNCAQPFYVGADGVKRVKPECL